ncbi:MAG: hypothetical protein WCT23_01705 [Candidatus Neomarinimicrobiota bacterium]
MKKTINIVSIIALIFGLFSCSDYEEVTIYHTPFLNIFANISAGGADSNFVHVYRTTGYGEPDRYELDSVLYHEFFNESSGDTIRYETLYIDTVYAINGAKVCYLYNGDSIKFYEAYQGVYRMVDTSVNIIAGEEYELVVETKDFETARSIEKVLAPINWIYPSELNDTLWISVSDIPDTIRWTNNGGAYDLKFYYTYYYEWDGSRYTYEFENIQTRESFWAYDSSIYDELFNPDPFKRYIENDWDADTLQLQVSIVAYSDSYLDYKSLQQMQMTTGFIRYPTINDFRVNITNSLGAFTSLSVSDKRTVMFVK